MAKKQAKKKNSKKIKTAKKTAKKKTRKKAKTNKTISVTLKTQCSPLALAYTLAILFSACVLLYSIFRLAGLFPEAAKLMQICLFSYSLTIFGIITGMVEAAVWGMIIGLVAAKLYNKFS